MVGDERGESAPWIPPIGGAYSEPPKAVPRRSAPRLPRPEPDETEAGAETAADELAAPTKAHRAQRDPDESSFPPPPPPMPPPMVQPRRSNRGRILLAAAAVVLVVGLVAAAVTVLTGDEAGTDTDRASPTTETTAAPTSTEEPATTTTADDSVTSTTAAGQDDAPWPVVEGGGLFRVSLPPALTSMAVNGDLTDVGARMFPDDPGLAEKMDDIARISFNGPRTQLVAVDPVKLATELPADLVEIQGETGFAGRNLDELVTAFEQTMLVREGTDGVRILNSGRLDTVGGQMAWFDIGKGDGIGAHQYITSAGDWMFIIGFWTNDFEVTRPLSDQIAASFVPLPPPA